MTEYIQLVKLKPAQSMSWSSCALVSCRKNPPRGSIHTTSTQKLGGRTVPNLGFFITAIAHLRKYSARTARPPPPRLPPPPCARHNHRGEDRFGTTRPRHPWELERKTNGHARIWFTDWANAEWGWALDVWGGARRDGNTVGTILRKIQ